MSGTSHYKIKEIKILQNKTVQTIYNRSPLHPTNTLFNNIQITPLHIINTIQIKLLIYKIKNNYIKNNFKINYRYIKHTNTKQDEEIILNYHM